MMSSRLQSFPYNSHTWSTEATEHSAWDVSDILLFKPTLFPPSLFLSKDTASSCVGEFSSNAHEHAQMQLNKIALYIKLVVGALSKIMLKVTSDMHTEP